MHLIDVDQLKTLMAIADSGSFTKAAEAVHKTQSAVSMQMKRLEEDISRPIFTKDGRSVKFTEDGRRLLDYARRIVRLSHECMNSFSNAALSGHVRLGVPDDYADRYLPEILGRFTRTNPKVEVAVMCEPTPMLMERIQSGDLDLAIITHAQNRPQAEIIRKERLLFVTSSKHSAHEETPLPLALGRPTCQWRQAVTERLEADGRSFRILYSSWNSSAVGAAILAGLAVGVLPETAIRTGMRILGEGEGFPLLPSVKIALARGRVQSSALVEASPLIEALAGHIRQSLDNISIKDTIKAV